MIYSAYDYIAHCTLYSVRCTVYIIYCTVYIVHCTVYSCVFHLSAIYTQYRVIHHSVAISRVVN